MIANVSNNNNNTTGQDGTNIAEAAAAAVHARAQSELAKAAEEAQKVLQGLDHDEAQNEHVKIHLFDFSDAGAYLSKGSGDKMRTRKIYQEIYDKAGTAGWKITDVVPARGPNCSRPLRWLRRLALLTVRSDVRSVRGGGTRRGEGARAGGGADDARQHRREGGRGAGGAAAGGTAEVRLWKDGALDFESRPPDGRVRRFHLFNFAARASRYHPRAEPPPPPSFGHPGRYATLSVEVHAQQQPTMRPLQRWVMQPSDGPGARALRPGKWRATPRHDSRRVEP